MRLIPVCSNLRANWEKSSRPCLVLYPRDGGTSSVSSREVQSVTAGQQAVCREPVDEHFRNELVVINIITQFYEYAASHSVIYFKWVDFMVCKLSCSIKLFKKK